MTMIRRLLCAGAIAAAILVAVFGVDWFTLTSTPSVTLRNFQRIEYGMTLDEVNAIFGMRGEMGRCSEGECPWAWKHGDNLARVSFGQDDGKAIYGYFIAPDGKEHSLPRKD
jgi:hypothetical protein